MAEGTKDKTSLIRSVNISFFKIAIIKYLDKKVTKPQLEDGACIKSRGIYLKASTSKGIPRDSH